MFSLGVIFFIVVVGLFPFGEAKRDDYFYNLIMQGQFEKYWKKIGVECSPEFKDLCQKLFS